MKGRYFLLLFFLGLVLSCVTGPEPGETGNPPEPALPAKTEGPAAASDEGGFDPYSISDEAFAMAKADVQTFIAGLNTIIRARNYNEWVNHLSGSYFETISSADFLDERTEELYRRDQTVAANLGRDPKMVEKKVLRNPRDYFTNVVVPSRSNDRVDDITFISETRIRAYTVDNRGVRLVLYDLAEIGEGKWEIIN